jgi:hypothetical protein
MKYFAGQHPLSVLLSVPFLPHSDLEPRFIRHPSRPSSHGLISAAMTDLRSGLSSNDLDGGYVGSIAELIAVSAWREGCRYKIFVVHKIQSLICYIWSAPLIHRLVSSTASRSMIPSNPSFPPNLAISMRGFASRFAKTERVSASDRV